jgi:hypothetical protein
MDLSCPAAAGVISPINNNCKPRNDWILCFCTVNFDLDYGQKLEYLFPSTVTFTEEEKHNICFLAFPESSNNEGDHVYSFRLRRVIGSESRGVTKSLYGFVFFRQTKNATISRGYLQKSVVLISSYPFINLFKQVVRVVGPLYFEHGAQCLEMAYQHALMWNFSTVGVDLELPLLGTTLHIHVPNQINLTSLLTKSPTSHGPEKDQVAKHIQAVNIYHSFKGLITKLWLLWELVLIGEPILVVSHSPEVVSDAVLGLISLISPIEYSGDFRPYFTIHDSDFKHYSNNKNVPPAVILGVTNPFFFKALGHWPHVLTLSGDAEYQKLSVVHKNGKEQKVKVGEEYKDEVKTKYKPFLDTDKKDLSKILLKKSESPMTATANNEILRRTFCEFTTEFLRPVEDYFDTLVPNQKSFSPFQRPPRVQPFREVTFLQRLIDEGRKIKEIEFYRKFIRSQNFVQWFKSKKQNAAAKIRDQYLQCLEKFDPVAAVQGRQEIEIVDLYVTLTELSRDSGLSSNIKSKLKEIQEKVFASLPQDLQASLQLNKLSLTTASERENPRPPNE